VWQHDGVFVRNTASQLDGTGESKWKAYPVDRSKRVRKSFHDRL